MLREHLLLLLHVEGTFGNADFFSKCASECQLSDGHNRSLRFFCAKRVLIDYMKSSHLNTVSLAKIV